MRFIDLSILSDVFFIGVTKLLDCKTCKLLDIEEEKKRLERLMKIKCRNSEFKHSFYTSPQIESTKDNRSRGRKTMLWRSTLVLNTVSEVSGLVIHQLTSCVVSITGHHQWLKFHMMACILFDKGCIQKYVRCCH